MIKSTFFFKEKEVFFQGKTDFSSLYQFWFYLQSLYT